MGQSNKKIGDGLKKLAAKHPDILSGVVVSVDATAHTIEVRTSLQEDTDTDTLTVSLSAVSENGNGHICYPAVGSNVIIGCVDGPGEYTLIRASNIDKHVITIGGQVLTMDGTKYTIQTGSESLGSIMHDLLAALEALTVGTIGGPSTTPINLVTITAIKTRLTAFLN